MLVLLYLKDTLIRLDYSESLENKILTRSSISVFDLNGFQEEWYSTEHDKTKKPNHYIGYKKSSVTENLFYLYEPHVMVFSRTNENEIKIITIIIKKENKKEIEQKVFDIQKRELTSKEKEERIEKYIYRFVMKNEENS